MKRKEAALAALKEVLLVLTGVTFATIILNYVTRRDVDIASFAVGLIIGLIVIFIPCYISKLNGKPRK